jgi:Fe-S-cluster containining protein
MTANIIIIIFNNKSYKSRGDDTMFQCDKCGACCMNLKRSEIYSDLDRGDGICIHFNEETKLCNIYDNRPDICNVDKLYKLFFADKISVSKYYQLNYQACVILKGRK